MKRVTWILAILLLVLAALAAFLAGWLPLRIEPGSLAVLVTKTGGVHPDTVMPGGFRWTAAALLPTNLRLLPFNPRPASRSVRLSGELPSAAAYSAFMAGEPDFSWSLELRLSAAVKPAALPGLVEREGIRDDEGLSAWLQGALERAAAALRPTLVSLAMDPAGSRSLADGSASAALASAAAAAVPELESPAVELVSASVPDIALYEEAREFYLAYMERYREAVEPALAKASATALGDRLRLESLEAYGELLARYPWLVDYLAIEAGLPPRASAPAVPPQPATAAGLPGKP